MTGFSEQLRLPAGVVAELRRRIGADLFPGEPDIWHRFDSTWSVDQVDVSRVLLVHDDADDMVPAVQARETSEAFGNRARLIITSGLGHRRILADPEVVAHVVGFIDELQADQPERGTQLGRGTVACTASDVTRPGLWTR